MAERYGSGSSAWARSNRASARSNSHAVERHLAGDVVPFGTFRRPLDQLLAQAQGILVAAFAIGPSGVVNKGVDAGGHVGLSAISRHLWLFRPTMASTSTCDTQQTLVPMIAGPEGGPSSDMQRYEG